MRKQRKFTADFETNVDEKDCRIWAYALCEIGNEDNFIYGNSIEDFIEWCKNTPENYVLYFHNLKFDGEYIFNFLLSNDYKYVTKPTERENKTFTTIISSMGIFYMIEIYFEVKGKGKKTKKVTIYDSLKIIPFSVDKIADKMCLGISKLDLDYETFREKGHILDPHEIEYIKNDVLIMAKALKVLFDLKLDKMTIGSCALTFYRNMFKDFLITYPTLDFTVDEDIRQAYKGGFTYLNPIYKNKEVGNGLVLDVNSLYPSVMRYEHLPYSTPIYFKGKYKFDKMYPLYVQQISVIFNIKKNKIPTIQIKRSLFYNDNEYIETTNGDIVTLTLTNMDLELFLENYNIDYIDYESGWKFKSKLGLFDRYVDIWSENKIKSKKENNMGLYLVSKLMLNSLCGKFGKNPLVRSKYPLIEEDGTIGYRCLPAEIGSSLYIPMGAFITSYARNKTIRTSQAIRDYSLKTYNKDYYIYSDTDSIHMLDMKEEELKQIVDIDDYRLGAWKLESTFKRGKYIRQKCYIEEGEEGMNVTIAGLPKKLGKYINFENFKEGLTLKGDDKSMKDHKLVYKHVKGGVMLVPVDFTIKK